MTGARGVALFHHRPERTDAEVESTVARFADGSLSVVAAAEGTTVAL
jgi:hypothetical protein